MRFRGLGAEQLRWMFTSFHLGHYQPLAWVTLGLDFTLWGMNPLGYHLTNVVLHALSAAVFASVAARLFALQRSTGSGQDVVLDRPALLFGVATALVWALHPLRVEAVAWVTQRREVLCGLFTLLALRNDLRGGRAWITWVLALLAMLSKATAVTLPVALILVGGWRERAQGSLFDLRGAVLAARRHAPVLALAVLFSLVAIEAQRTSGAMISWERLTLGDRAVLYLHSLGFYAWKTLLPLGLAPLYEGKIDADGYPVTGPLLVPALVSALAFAFAFVLAWRRRASAVLLLLLAYLAMAVPTGGFGQSGPQIAADRYTYQPGWVLSLLLAGGALALGRTIRARRVAIAAAATLLVTWTAVCVAQQRVWRDTETLWTHTLALSPATVRAHQNLAFHYARLAPPRDDLAEPHVREALRVLPAYGDALGLLAMIELRSGRAEAALECLDKLQRTDPDHVAVIRMRPEALWTLGRRDEAMAAFRRRAAVESEQVEAQWKLARVLAATGQSREATDVYSRACTRFPDSAVVLTDFAWLLATHPDAAVRDGRRALDLASRARALDANDVRALMAHSAALAETGDFDSARRELDAAYRSMPDAVGTLRSLFELVLRREPARAPPQYP